MKKSKKLPVSRVKRELVVEPGNYREPNAYLLEISRKIKLSKIIFIFVTVCFIIGMIFFFRKDITLENYRYLIRFFSNSGEYNGDYRTVYFDSASTSSIGIFHGDLATVSLSDVNLYSMKGNNTLSSKIAYGSPTLVTKGKYMLVYDLGGNSYQLFNNFSALTGETFEYPISTCTVSEEGMYAVVTKSLDYQSVVHIYDHNFNLLSKIYKDKYVMGVDIQDDGSEFMIISAYSKEGDYSSEIMTCKPYNSEAKASFELVGEFALMGSYFHNGSYAVVTDRGIHFYDSDGNSANTFDLAGVVPTKCVFADDYLVIAYNENIVGSDTGVIVFSTNGEKTAEYSIPDKILDIAAYNDKIYVLSSMSITELSKKQKDTVSASIDTGASRIFVCDADNIIVGYSNMIQAHPVEKLFGEDAN